MVALEQVNTLDDLRSYRSELERGINAVSDLLFRELSQDKLDLLGRIKDSDEYKGLESTVRSYVDTNLNRGKVPVSDELGLPVGYFQGIHDMLNRYKTAYDVQRALSDGMSPFGHRRGVFSNSLILTPLSSAQEAAHGTTYEVSLNALNRQMREYLTVDRVTESLMTIEELLKNRLDVFGSSRDEAIATLADGVGAVVRSAPQYKRMIVRVYEDTLKPVVEHAFEQE